MKKYLIILIGLFLFTTQNIIAMNNIEMSKASIQEKIENRIQLAERYYLLMLDEGIGTYSQNKSENYILDAKQLISNNTLSNKDRTNYTLQLNTIEKELKDSVTVKYNTLEGYFPLLKYTATSFFFSPEESEVHTLIKSPDYIAIKNACISLVSSLSGRGEVLFNSIPQNSKLEKLAFSIFKSDSSLSAHTNKDIVVLLEEQKLISQFHENNISKIISDKLFNAYSRNPLYIVTITKELSDKREYFYSLNAGYYNKDGYNEAESISSSAYAIDERSNWAWLIVLHLFFLFIAFSFTYYNQKKWDYKLYSISLIFFLLGRILPLILVPSIMVIKPDGDTHIIYAMWWIFLMGVAVFILPVIIIKMFYVRIAEYIFLPDIEGKGSIVGFSIASGVLAFLTVPYIFGFGNTLSIQNIVAFSLLSIAILLAGYVMGKVLDDNDKMDEKNLMVLALTSGLIMAAFLHSNSTYLNIISVITMILAGILLYINNHKINKGLKEETILTLEDEHSFDVECTDLQQVDLKEIVLNPPYQKFDYYQNVFKHIQNIYEGETTYCVLKGDGGAGKTVTAKILINSVGQRLAEENKPVLFLSSNCERNDGDEVPYGMFYDLLDSTLGMDLFGQRKKDEKFDNVVNMASKFMMGPVASFLVSDNTGEQKSFSKSDIYIFVKKKLEELSQKSTIIIFVDDLQWIDNASKELLQYLMEEFKSNAVGNMFFIFTVRDTQVGNEKVEELDLNGETYSIGYIDVLEQRQLLEKSFCISAKDSRWIANWAAELNSEHIYPYILVDTVGNLVRSDSFEIKDDRFSIKKDFDFDNPPIPEGTKNEVEQFFTMNPKYTEIVSFAATFGKEFHVTHLSSGLGIPYLEAVNTLDTLSWESGFVFDLLDKDDVYQFRSQILLDAVRSVIGYSTDGILSTHVSQSIRNYHALAAYALEKIRKIDNSSKVVMAIANHYYAAGKLHASSATEALMDAVNACRGLFEYDNALSYLDKVDEVTSITKQDSQKSDVLRLLVECDKANVQGIGAAEVVEKALAYIKKNTSNNDELNFAAVRACYDAALQNNYNQTWFAKSSQAAKEYLLPSQSTLIQAEGYHFMAIAMKAQTDEQKQEQLDYFNKAITLTQKEHPVTYAKIANSFAESLSYGSDDSKKQAKELFLDSLSIKENAEIKDLPGMARTYGGLGRLAFFSTLPNLKEAENYFKKDLEIAEEISDQRGISQMNSFLGSCKKAEKNHKDAVGYYDKSIEMQNNPFDVHVSYEGKLYCLNSMNDENKLLDALHAYVAIIDNLGTPPTFIVGKIVSVLEKYQHDDICKSLLDKLQHDTKK